MTRFVLLSFSALAALAQTGDDLVQRRWDGYRGIWYYNQPSQDRYVYKYSGGFATYPQQHVSIAIYRKEAGKTFFVYGGTVDGKQELQHFVSYFDHKTGMVPRPLRLLNKKTDDAHDNPTLVIDKAGYLYVFSNSHGPVRPTFIHRSRKPYSIEGFELISQPYFSYSQPWYSPDRGFFFLHTRYEDGGRSLFFMTSPDARSWTEPRKLARIEQGDYQISRLHDGRVATVFDYHPFTKGEAGLNFRTNLYYLDTRDWGRTWRNVTGQEVTLPVTAPGNAALVHDYKSEGLLAYIKDLAFDAQGHPVILFLTARCYRSGPECGPREWHTARWTGKNWEILPFTTSDHNYDHGSLYIEPDGTWRIIAPTEPGPQAYGTGGEVVLWQSRNKGRNWLKKSQLTKDSRYNHTYVRRPLDAHPDFYAIWADGDAFAPSESSIYFTNRDGSKVFHLPPHMSTDYAKPEIVTFR